MALNLIKNLDLFVFFVPVQKLNDQHCTQISTVNVKAVRNKPRGLRLNLLN